MITVFLQNGKVAQLDGVESVKTDRFIDGHNVPLGIKCYTADNTEVARFALPELAGYYLHLPDNPPHFR